MVRRPRTRRKGIRGDGDDTEAVAVESDEERKEADQHHSVKATATKAGADTLPLSAMGPKGQDTTNERKRKLQADISAHKKAKVKAGPT